MEKGGDKSWGHWGVGRWRGMGERSHMSQRESLLLLYRVSLFSILISLPFSVIVLQSLKKKVPVVMLT